MTASKSSRARNARIGAQASAARNAARSGPAIQNGTAKNGAVKNEAVKNEAVKNEAVKSRSAAGNDAATSDGGASRTSGANRGGTATKNRERDQTRAAVTRHGTAKRGAGPRVDAEQGGPPPWLQITTLVLALAGLGVSIYLTIAHFTESTLAGCSESGLVNCTKVTTSPQSYVFGIPVAVLGLAFYLFAVAIMSPWAWQARRREVHLLRIASMAVSIGFVLYLIYAELFTIGSICLYCTSIHAITFALFVLTAVAAAAWGVKPGTPWKLRLRRQPAEAAEA